MKATKLFLILVVLVFLSISSLALAQSTANIGPIVPCGNQGQSDCKTSDFFVLAKNLVNYFVFALAVPIATAAIAYAGISMATHPAEEGKRTEAKEILWAAIIGLVLSLGAWLIVNTLVAYLVKPNVQSDINNTTRVLNNR